MVWTLGFPEVVTGTGWGPGNGRMAMELPGHRKLKDI